MHILLLNLSYSVITCSIGHNLSDCLQTGRKPYQAHFHMLYMGLGRIVGVNILGVDESWRRWSTLMISRPNLIPHNYVDERTVTLYTTLKPCIMRTHTTTIA